MPRSLFGFVFLFGKWHQAAIAALSLLLFVVGTAPLEIQRRIINTSAEGGSYSSIAVLVLIYLGLTLSEGAIKFIFNLYTSWIGEFAIRWLRLFALGASSATETPGTGPTDDGIELSIVLAEADPVGGFVGECVSQPLLQAGLLVGVGGYLIYLQPFLAILVAVVFFPQLGFVPLMQAAINRRVAAKVSAARDVSRGIVDARIGGDLDNQVRRVSFLFDTNMSIYRIKFVMNFLMNLMTQLGYAAIFALGGYYVVTGKTEIGTIVAFTSGLTKINDPWGSLVDWYRNLKATEVKYQMIRDACLGEQTSRAA